MALSLLSLVFLLVISLVNLVGIDLSLADTRKEKVLAQAHARMGMMVAIGELQKHLGPDTRVSATADILDERIESGKKYESTYYLSNSSTNLQGAVSKNQAIDLNENGQLDTVPFGQRYWTGVWKHRARRKGASDDYRAAKPFPTIWKLLIQSVLLQWQILSMIHTLPLKLHGLLVVMKGGPRSQLSCRVL